jgi:hypothetical protein
MPDPPIDERTAAAFVVPCWPPPSGVSGQGRPYGSGVVETHPADEPSGHPSTPVRPPGGSPTVSDSSKNDLTVAGVALRFGIVALTLGTAYIHSTLGGLLFTLNATGYAVAAVAMIVPLALAIRFRWFIRLGLIGYAMASIIGWAIMGPRYDVAYIAKAIEVALVFLLVVDFLRADGNPVTVVRRELALGLSKVTQLRGASAA